MVFKSQFQFQLHISPCFQPFIQFVFSSFVSIQSQKLQAVERLTVEEIVAYVEVGSGPSHIPFVLTEVVVLFLNLPDSWRQYIYAMRVRVRRVKISGKAELTSSTRFLISAPNTVELR